MIQFSIELSALTKRYGSTNAVNNISLKCRSGITFGLLGANGAGKSTLIKMLTTLLPATSGNATVAGCDLATDPRGIRRNIGYVSQMLSADGELTGYENLSVSAKLYLVPSSERSARLARAAAFMGLSDSMHRKVRQYSGGMIRRLEIAQAMLHRPSILFLDEPSVGLDPSAKRVVWERIGELRREFGTTIFMTTHDMEEADRLCDTIAVMHRGDLVALDAPAALKAKVGPSANLNSVFVHFTGTTFSEGGELRDVSRTRSTVNRLG